MLEKEIERLKGIERTLRNFDFPPQIIIELTSLCNFKCVHCNHKELKRTKGFMSEELYKRIIGEIVEVNPATEIWPTFYGEAFILGDRLYERLRYAADMGCQNLVLNSNGSLLNQKDWIDQLLHSGLKRFILSLDGFEPDTFESIRVGGKRNEIYDAVEKLLARKEELKLEYPVIQCQYSLMEKNKHEFPQFKEFWEQRGAEVKSRNMLSWSNSGSVHAQNLDYHSDFRIPCAWGLSTMAIHYTGDIVACACDYEGHFKAGNVNEMSLKEIWNGPHFEKLRRKHLENRWDEIPEICKTCPDWQAVGAVYHDNASKQEIKKFTRPFWFKSNDEDESAETTNLRVSESCQGS